MSWNSKTERPEILPDKAKVAALEAIKKPTTKKEAESIIGSIKQLSAWSKETTVLTEHMRRLIRKDEHFSWTPKHDEEWQRVKRMLRNLSRVTPFKMGDETEIFCDASKIGLSYVLVQVRNCERVVITCGSVALTDAQKNYCVTELEALAITHAIGKLAYYLKGMQDTFTVYTDHKPLTTMLQKNLCDVMNDRLGSMMEKVAWARFNVVYLPGNKNHIADLLSRNPSEEDKAEEVPRHAHLRARIKCCRGLVRKDVALNNLAEIARRDEDYKAIIKAVKEGERIDKMSNEHPGKRELGTVWSQVSVEEVLVVNYSWWTVQDCSSKRRPDIT